MDEGFTDLATNPRLVNFLCLQFGRARSLTVFLNIRFGRSLFCKMAIRAVGCYKVLQLGMFKLWQTLLDRIFSSRLGNQVASTALRHITRCMLFKKRPIAVVPSSKWLCHFIMRPDMALITIHLQLGVAVKQIERIKIKLHWS